jgi:hypothetical protein
MTQFLSHKLIALLSRLRLGGKYDQVAIRDCRAEKRNGESASAFRARPPISVDRTIVAVKARQ